MVHQLRLDGAEVLVVGQVELSATGRLLVFVYLEICDGGFERRNSATQTVKLVGVLQQHL